MLLVSTYYRKHVEKSMKKLFRKSIRSMTLLSIVFCIPIIFNKTFRTYFLSDKYPVTN